jgi:ABC-type amino acid transport substrate-binding protein
VGGDANYGPYVFKGEDGKLTGLAVDVLRETAKQVGLSFEVTVIANRAEVVEALKDRSIDISLANRASPSRPFMAISQPFVFSRGTFIGRRNLRAHEIGVVAVVKGSASVTFMELNYPSIQQVEIGNTEGCFAVLRQQVVDACLMGREQAFFFIKKLKLSPSDFTLLPVNYDYFLSFGTHVDDNVLTGILIKGLDAVPTAKKKELLKKWLLEPDIKRLQQPS